MPRQSISRLVKIFTNSDVTPKHFSGRMIYCIIGQLYIRDGERKVKRRDIRDPKMTKSGVPHFPKKLTIRVAACHLTSITKHIITENTSIYMLQHPLKSRSIFVNDYNRTPFARTVKIRLEF